MELIIVGTHTIRRRGGQHRCAHIRSRADAARRNADSPSPDLRRFGERDGRSMNRETDLITATPWFRALGTDITQSRPRSFLVAIRKPERW